MPMHESLKMRFWEVDLLRGLAVVMMVAFHFFYDLNYFGIYRVNVSSGFWFYFARITAGLFILLVGVSLVLSSSRRRCKAEGGAGIHGVPEEGSLDILLGLVVTVATYLLVGDGFIVFESCTSSASR
jgi:uncharacterized membrane protein